MKNCKKKLSILVFTNVSRSDPHVQLGCIVGLLIGDMRKNLVSHVVAWLSHKSRRKVKSVTAEKLLAASKSIDLGKEAAPCFSENLDTKVIFYLVIYSKELFSTISTQENAADCSPRGDVGPFCFEFATGIVENIS